MKKEHYTDRVDVSHKVSLYEYAIIRICSNTYALDDGSDAREPVMPRIHVDFIGLEDVREALNEAEPGYFSFIGSDLETELANLDNNYLTIHIFSLEQYAGIFELNR
jgi:hypothetical protein